MFTRFTKSLRAVKAVTKEISLCQRNLNSKEKFRSHFTKTAFSLYGLTVLRVFLFVQFRKLNLVKNI